MGNQNSGLWKKLHNLRKIVSYQSFPPSGFVSTNNIILAIYEKYLADRYFIINKSDISISRCFRRFPCSYNREIPLDNMFLSRCINDLCFVSIPESVSSFEHETYGFKCFHPSPIIFLLESFYEVPFRILMDDDIVFVSISRHDWVLLG
jgi:hypothetical protein